MDGIAAYQENSITTQSGAGLVVMLYDGAIRFLREVINGMDRADHEHKAKFLNKAAEIIDELDGCLDMETGGEIAQNLRALYGFMRRHLTAANIKNDPQLVRNVIALLEDLNEGWKAVTG